MHNYFQQSNIIAYIDDDNQKIELIQNSIDDNSKKSFNAKFKQVKKSGEVIEQNFDNQQQLNNFINRFLILDNSKQKKKKKRSKSRRKKKSKNKIKLKLKL